MPIKDKLKGSRSGWGDPSGCNTGLISVKEEREGWTISKSLRPLHSSESLHQANREFPRLSLEKSYIQAGLSQLQIPIMLSHWLQTAWRKHGLGINTMVDPNVQQLEPVSQLCGLFRQSELYTLWLPHPDDKGNRGIEEEMLCRKRIKQQLLSQISHKGKNLMFSLSPQFFESVCPYSVIGIQ